ncbi:MAG: glycerate kinase [Dehalococcoidia bacterium]
MRIVIAPQEYKGTLTAEEAARALAEGARKAAPDAEIEEIPLADGGPGTVRAIIAASGGELRRATVTGPMDDAVEAEWGLLADGTAVIEMAAAAGLVIVPEDKRDPKIATTFGVGELVRAALDAGCARIIVGMGGSATNDGGAGMVQALGVRLLDEPGEELARGGAALARLACIDTSRLDARLKAVSVVAATDVQNPLCGPSGASVVYGPQKGADEDMAAELDAALARWAVVIRQDLGVDVEGLPGAGAAGGLGAGMAAFLGAEIQSGIEIVARVVRLRERLAGADVMITGEGRLDGQTGYGKTVAGALAIAAEASVPAIIVPGTLGPGWEAAGSRAEVIEPVVSDTVESTAGDPAGALAAAAERALRRWLAAR